MYPSQNLTLMTDLYQLTMMQGYYTYHKTSQRVYALGSSVFCTAV